MLVLLGFLSVVQFAHALLSDQVYIQLEPESVACFRLLNGTHQFGCQSSRKGDVGLVVRVNSLGDLRLVEECWKSRYPEWDGGFAVLISVLQFHSVNYRLFDKLRSSLCVSMVLLYETEPLPDTLGLAESDDAICPNEHSGIYNNCSNWNQKGASVGRGLAFTDWPKPVVLLTNTSNIKKIEQCADAVNKASGTPTDWPVSFPLCVISVKVFSYAAGNSDLCMRRNKGVAFELENPVSFCDPLQDVNVFISLPPKAADKQSVEPQPRTAKYLAIATRMDSLSFIPETSPGDLSALTSIMTLLAAAKAIAAKENDFEKASNLSNRRILISFFHGEAFDYIGSSRTLFDMMKESFPAPFDEKMSQQKEIITLNQLEGLVEVQQIGTSETEFWAHLHPSAYLKDKELTDKLIGAGKSPFYALKMADGKQLPPSSLYTFYRNATASFRSGILLTQFTDQYVYPRVNSMMDHSDHSNISTLKIQRAIKHGAEILVSMAKSYVGLNPSEVTISDTYIKELFDCFIVAKDWWACDRFDAVLEPFKPYKSIKQAKTTYIGADGKSLIRNLVFGLAVDATGKRSEAINVADEEQCDQLNHQQSFYNYVWQRSGDKYSCVQSTVFTTKALSPAFADDDMDLVNTTFSTWTEASYSLADGSKNGRVVGPRLFVMEPKKNEQTAIIVGLVIAFISLLVFGRFKASTFVFDEGEPMAESGEPL